MNRRIAISSLVFLLLLAAPNVAVAQSYARSPATQAQLATWRTDIRKTLYIPEALPALNPQSFGRFSPESGVVAERLLYSTTYGMRVAAILYRPEHPKGKIPAYVLINGHGGDKYSWYATYTGVLFARGGAAVLTYDPLGEGESNIERRSHTRAHDFVVDIPSIPQRLTGFMVAEAMQGISYLQQRSEMDPQRVSILAYSMGTYIGVLAGAVDPRIDAVVLSAGGNLDGPKGYWDSGKPMCQGGSYTALIPVLGDRGAVIYALNQQRGTTFIMNGTADSLITKPNTQQPFFDDLAKRVVEITGTKKSLFETYWFQDAGHRPSWDTRPSMLWIEDHIGFPNWTREQIQQMPETHIGNWFIKTNADVETEFRTEKSEAGINALGINVPAIPRTQLNVLPDSAWPDRNHSLIYETWLGRASSDGSSGIQASSRSKADLLY
ncbi:MAG TPA: alpha/beta fold hydrolase [Edaphobacter sp.]|jgi:dienelactone hydrolase|nr:alpha/beta fold hydrolase [Edaphobacter sp.]